jgi:phage FluMu protein Com
VYDKKKCPDCSALLVSPHVQLSSVGCPEHGHHRTIRCLDCGHVMLEPRRDAEQGGIGSLYDPDNRPAH